MLNNKTLLITGGTGSFGKNFLFYVLKKFKKIKKVIIFSRDELKQFELSLQIEKKYASKVRFFLGDVRDKTRLIQALSNVDIVVHAAALKQVTTAEYNPLEFVKTNIGGAQNLVESSINCNVKHVIALSTDKAASPINLYGATKLCSDKIFTAANNVIGKNKIKFSIVRYGNVFASRGSVINLFNYYKKKNGWLPITDREMTRFSLSIEEALEFVILTIKKAVGGEIFVPKIPSYRIMDLANAFDPKIKKKIIGIRPGEKKHEELITSADSFNTYEFKKYYTILPASFDKKYYSKRYAKYKKTNKVNKNFTYNSLNNKNFLTIKDLQEIIKKNLK